MWDQRCHAVIVGGSLVGLSMAIALGVGTSPVTVLGRTSGRRYQGGGGVGVDLGLPSQVTGLAGGPPVCHRWTIVLCPLGASWVAELRGPSAALLDVPYHRMPLEGAGLEVLGDRGPVETRLRLTTLD
jgi:hypothetical protein